MPSGVIERLVVALGKFLAVLSSLVLAATLWIVSPGAPDAAAQVDVYQTEGSLSYQGRTHVHYVNGRYWDTVCSQYSTNVRRCETFIWAKPIRREGNIFAVREGWQFNNMTYLPSPRSTWRGNPLAVHTPSPPGYFESGGRQWRTECDTPVTGRNGCRSFIKGTTYRQVGPNRYEQLDDQWIFNNIVLFSTGPHPTPGPTSTPTPTPDPTPTPSPDPTPTPDPTVSPSPSTPPEPVRDPRQCDAPLPTGWSYTSSGRPYRPGNDLYSPEDAFHPHALGSYIRSYNASAATNAQKHCVMTAVGLQLMDESVVQIHDGRTVRWLPYDFEFSANPSAPMLEPGWYSGLAQGSAITTMRVIGVRTGDEKWDTYAQEIANSLDVPYAAGGVKNYIDFGGASHLWQEEYPTGDHPTTVLNGNNLALIGLALHRNSTGDPLATRLFDEGIASYHKLLPLFEMSVSNNAMSTYDLVRGYPEAPVRLVSDNGTLTRATLNGRRVGLPVEASTEGSTNVLVNGDFSAPNEGEWRPVNQHGAIVGGRVIIHPNGTGHTGVQQVIPEGTFAEGSPVTMQFDTRMVKQTSGASTAPLVSVQGVCPEGVYTNLVRHSAARGENWGTYRASFNAPAEGCGIAVNLLQDLKDVRGGEVEFDNIVVRQADHLGRHLEPDYDYYVWRTPVQELTLHGQGSFEVEVYTHGAWTQIDSVTASAAGVTVRIPEEFTGRIVNHKYHEAHISELRQLGNHSGDPLFATWADRWVHTAINHPN